MPNGRSGGFLISRMQLELCLEALPDGAVVGRSVASFIPGIRASQSSPGVSVPGTMAMLDAFGSDRVWVEEQDSSYYILHLDLEVHDSADPDPAKWITIQPDSPLFEALRQMHKR
jgi:hypothetical protein